ncbi:hypothetical protein [Rathayibacter iranicus]|nr:hypothetical protein [Rathayibacter iranicus]MWV30377.1 hypothetical protein [Rathayibacter iranicus NCPPB 2253 = VKM Ac-1602]PWJ64286.1 hypothetical protein B0H03_10562 [Rathayibacter iranicus NCPPB 2253 = VKM Ac-1602]
MNVASRGDLFVHRLLEQIEPWTPWYRRSWEGGSLLALWEFSGSLKWVPERVVAQGALDRFSRRILGGLGNDAGLAGLSVREQLHDILKSKLSYSSQRHRQLDHLIQFAESRYFSNWKDKLKEHGDNLHVERASRYLSSAVLDQGYDGEWLRKYVHSLIRNGAKTLDIVEELESLFFKSPIPHRGLVLIHKIPDHIELEKSPQWRSKDVALGILSDWKDQRVEGDLIIGSLEFEVEALDPGSATRIVAERITRLENQLRFEPGEIKFAYDPFFRMESGAKRLAQRRKAIVLRSRTAGEKLRNGIVLNGQPTALDDALQLASPLTDGPDTLAVSSAWASIESLLTDPSDGDERGFGGKAIAADRAASILAAAWGRAELGRLSYLVEREERANQRLLSVLESVEDTAGRAEVMYSWLLSGNVIDFLDFRSQQALNRMKQLAEDPKSTLNRVRKYINHALHRLYRQRNMVLHGGDARPVGLESTLLCSGPLISAVLDQMIHAEQFHGVAPLQLAARAEVGLTAGGLDGAWNPANLLSF